MTEIPLFTFVPAIDVAATVVCVLKGKLLSAGFGGKAVDDLCFSKLIPDEHI